jgi:ribosomal protein S4
MEMNRMAEEKKEEVVTKNKGDYALNTFKDIWKYDRARLLDLGNDFQVLLSQKDEDRNEEARARSNFLKLVEDERRPFSHTMTDATRLLPDVIALLAGAGVKAASKGISKLTGKVNALPAREDIDLTIAENLIIEFYSK